MNEITVKGMRITKMFITDVIKKLEEFKQSNGDIPVVWDVHMRMTMPVSPEVQKKAGTKVVVMNSNVAMRDM